MVSIQRILCPTDFSSFSRRAFRHAIRLAQWIGCEIVALHVREEAGARPRTAGGGEAGSAPAKGSARLRSFVEPARAAGLSVRTVVGRGDDVGEILRHVRSEAADLVVMGTHGRAGLERLVLGSVSEEVLRKAECPVIVVPSPHEESGDAVDLDEADEEPRPEPGEVPYRHILCPIDFSEMSLTALRQAHELARDAGARLTILHAVELPLVEAGAKRHGPAWEVRRRMTQAAVERMLGVVPPVDGGRPAWDAVILDGKAHTLIVDLAGELAADLIVMGVRGHAAADHALFGSTAQHVTRAAACPVLTLHAAGAP